MAITLRDVAKAAGVSPIAVSKVLHGKGGSARVGEVKAAHIRAVAESLQYTPNTLARSLRGGKTYNIGLVFDNFGPIGTGSRYLGLLLDGISRACFESEYSLTICPKLSSHSSYNIGDGRFDGVVWAKNAIEPEVVEAANRAGVKTVHLHVPPHMAVDASSSYLCCDNSQGLELAIQHLASLGHKRIAFINEIENVNVAEARDRSDEFYRISQLLGMEARVEDQGLCGLDGTGMREWMVANPNITAVILRTENLAGAFYAAAYELGIQIPSDLSVIAFDSTEYCNSLHPRLTAIHQPVEKMAYEAVKVLIKSIESSDFPGQRLVYPCSLDIRESTTIIDSKLSKPSCKNEHSHS